MAHIPALQTNASYISTDTVTDADRMAYWVDSVCRHLIAVECDSTAEQESFRGSIHMQQQGKVGIAQIESCAQSVSRTSELIAQADEEYFLLNIQRAGSSQLTQRHRQAPLATGDFALYSSTSHYHLQFDADFKQTVLMFPADMLRSRSPHIDKMLARTIDGRGPLARLLLSVADSCDPSRDCAFPPDSAWHLGNALTETLLACIATVMPESKPMQSKLPAFQLSRIKRFVLEHLSDPELSVAAIAQALQLSPSYIHRLFEDEQLTFGAWLLKHRLLACKAALSHPASGHWPISQIAYRCGFNNASHFSRAFRAAYGMTARDWRALQLAERATGTALPR